ncbi:MAG TPA: hypothetical protein GX736_02335 [Mogibacterium sp.]|nr:hypothetical protein [Mogibacterium sp.]
MILSKKNRTKITLFLCCIFISINTIFAYAVTTIMTYNGEGIRQKPSVNSFSLSKTTSITVKHNTTAVRYIGTTSPDNYKLIIYLQRKNGLSYSYTGDSFSLKGIGSKSKTWNKGSGRYRLFFQSPYPGEGQIWAGFDINGKVTK